MTLDNQNADLSDRTFTITTNWERFRVTSPNTSVSWRGGENRSITWSTGGLGGNVRIELYGGAGYYLIAGSTSNDGSYSWTIPNTLQTASNYRVRIVTLDNQNADLSDGTFTISTIDGGINQYLGTYSGSIEVTRNDSIIELVGGSFTERFDEFRSVGNNRYHVIGSGNYHYVFEHDGDREPIDLSFVFGPDHFNMIVIHEPEVLENLPFSDNVAMEIDGDNVEVYYTFHEGTFSPSGANYTFTLRGYYNNIEVIDCSGRYVSRRISALSAISTIKKNNLGQIRRLLTKEPERTMVDPKIWLAYE